MEIFLGVASHELRTPLIVLKLTVYSAQRRLRQAIQGMTPDLATTHQLEAVMAILARADEQMRRQSRLASDLLDASHVHTGTLDLRLERLDLAALVDAVVEEQRLAHPDRVITLDLPIEQPVPALVDGDRISQLVTNLVDTAVKYADLTLPIAVTLGCAGTQACVCVRDHGPGLSQCDQLRVWELYILSGRGH
jgi:signal transduction histidine kinase